MSPPGRRRTPAPSPHHTPCPWRWRRTTTRPCAAIAVVRNARGAAVAHTAAGRHGAVAGSAPHRRRARGSACASASEPLCRAAAFPPVLLVLALACNVMHVRRRRNSAPRRLIGLQATRPHHLCLVQPSGGAVQHVLTKLAQQAGGCVVGVGKHGSQWSGSLSATRMHIQPPTQSTVVSAQTPRKCRAAALRTYVPLCSYFFGAGSANFSANLSPASASKALLANPRCRTGEQTCCPRGHTCFLTYYRVFSPRCSVVSSFMFFRSLEYCERNLTLVDRAPTTSATTTRYRNTPLGGGSAAFFASRRRSAPQPCTCLGAALAPSSASQQASSGGQLRQQSLYHTPSKVCVYNTTPSAQSQVMRTSVKVVCEPLLRNEVLGVRDELPESIILALQFPRPLVDANAAVPAPYAQQHIQQRVNLHQRVCHTQQRRTLGSCSQWVAGPATWESTAPPE